jgi:predicted DNA-binding protein YlxM (UPF0122 family)
MTPKKNLKLDDLVSPTMKPEEYLETYGNKIKNVYEKYEPKSEILSKIKEHLKNKREKLRVVVLGADWCN